MTVEILSNWGNASSVGLTEVEFFDLSNTKLYVSPHDVDIRSANTPGDPGHLVNRNLAVSGAALNEAWLHVFFGVFLFVCFVFSHLKKKVLLGVPIVAQW